MVYKVSFILDTNAEGIGELEDIFDAYNIQYKLEEVQESEVR